MVVYVCGCLYVCECVYVFLCFYESVCLAPSVGSGCCVSVFLCVGVCLGETHVHGEADAFSLTRRLYIHLRPCILLDMPWG